MVSLKSPLLWIVAAALSAPLTAKAATDPLAPLVNEALAKNRSLAASRMLTRRADADVRAAYGQWLPGVHAESRASQLHDVPDLGDLVNPAYAALDRITGTSDFPTGVSLTMPAAAETHVRVVQPLLHEPLRASVGVARASRDVAHEAFGADARRLAAEVQAAYLQQALLRRVVEVQESALTLVQENERVSERLLDAGRATPEAVLRARADRAEVEQRLGEAREQAAAAARELNRIAGREPGTPVVALPDSVFDVPLEIGDEEAVRSALARREELAQADAGVRAAEAGVHAATGSLLPVLAAAVDVGWQGASMSESADHRAWTASLVASWDVFSGGSQLARRSGARADAERARTQRRDAEERIVVEVRNAHESALVAREAVATAQVRVEAARRTWSLVRRRYEEGSASPLELTDARTTLTTSETNAVLTLYRYALRRVDLERAAALRDLPFEKGARR